MAIRISHTSVRRRIGFYQVGRESVAIAEVQESPEIVYREQEEEGKDEKSIH